MLIKAIGKIFFTFFGEEAYTDQYLISLPDMELRAQSHCGEAGCRTVSDGATGAEDRANQKGYKIESFSISTITRFLVIRQKSQIVSFLIEVKMIYVYDTLSVMLFIVRAQYEQNQCRSW